MDYSPPGPSVHGISQARILEWLAISSPGDLPDPGIKPMSPALQADSLLFEPPEKPAVGEAKRGAGCICFPNQRETFWTLKFNSFLALLTAYSGKSCFIFISPPF